MQKINIDTTIGRYIGRKAYGGIDLSATQDLTCLVWIFPWKHDAEGFDVVMRTWCPRERVYDPKNRYRDMYQAWEKMGYLEPTAGNVIDYQYVRQRLLDDASRLKLCRIGVDRYFSAWDFCRDLNEKLGGSEKQPVIIFSGMGYRSMALPTQKLEELLAKKKVNHGGNPILRFMADGVAVSMDPAGNRKPNKDESQCKIDGIIGLLLALDQYIRDPQIEFTFGFTL